MCLPKYSDKLRSSLRRAIAVFHYEYLIRLIEIDNQISVDSSAREIFGTHIPLFFLNIVYTKKALYFDLKKTSQKY